MSTLIVFKPYLLQLMTGSTVKITKCSLHFDETDISGSGVVVVQEVEITGVTHLTEQELSGLLQCYMSRIVRKPAF